MWLLARVREEPDGSCCRYTLLSHREEPDAFDSKRRLLLLYRGATEYNSIEGWPQGGMKGDFRDVLGEGGEGQEEELPSASTRHLYWERRSQQRKSLPNPRVLQSY